MEETATSDELACTYAALILADDDLAVTGEKLTTILKAAGVGVEPFWPSLYAKALTGVNIKDLICNIGSASAAPAAGSGAAAGDGGAAETKKDEKKEEKDEEEEEEDDDMGFGLFD